MFIQPVIDETLAHQRLTRKRFKRLRRIVRALLRFPAAFLSRSNAKSDQPRFRRPLPYMEVVWLPYFHVIIETQRKGKIENVDVLIGGHDSSFTIFDLSTTQPDPSNDHEKFDAGINEAQADHLAREGLVRFVIRSPGWGAKPSIGKTKSITPIHYPFWVYYFERRPGTIDVKLLDALTGQLTGTKAKVAFLAAITAPQGHHLTKQHATPPTDAKY